MMDGTQLNRVVRVRTMQRADMGLALVQSYAPFPTFGLVRDDGSHFDWGASMCEEATPEEEAAYWRARAERAEEGQMAAIRTAEKANDLNERLLQQLDRLTPSAP